MRKALESLVATVTAALLAIASMPAVLLAQELYKHVDENGTVTYTDRPQSGNEEARDLGLPNVASPEARRDVEAEMRQESAEESARQRAQEESINSAVEIERRLEDERSFSFTIQSILDRQPSQDMAQEPPAEIVVPEPEPAPVLDGRRGDRPEREREFRDRESRGREAQQHRERELR